MGDMTPTVMLLPCFPSRGLVEEGVVPVAENNVLFRCVSLSVCVWWGGLVLLGVQGYTEGQRPSYAASPWAVNTDIITCWLSSPVLFGRGWQPFPGSHSRAGRSPCLLYAETR